MTRKITENQQRRAERLRTKLADIVTLATNLSDCDLADLLARLEQPSIPDGYPNSSGQGGSASADPTSSTERAMLQRSQKAIPDPIRDAGLRFLDDLSEAKYVLVDAVRQKDAISQSHVVTGRVNSIPDCEGCGEPILGQRKAGMDRACYEAWRREPLPRDRVRFRAKRRESQVAV